MRKPPAGLVLIGITVTACAAVLLVHAHNASHPQAARAPVSTRSTTPQPSPTKAHRGARRKPTAQHKQPAKETGDSPGDGAMTLLREKVLEFIQACYLIKPSDTEAIRRERVGRLAPSAVLKTLDLGLSTGTPADKARIHLRLTQRGIPVEPKMEVTPATDEPIDKFVKVPVTIVVKREDGTEVSRHTVHTVAWWEYTNERWTIQSFNELRR
jgi:hypothetical protein